MNYQLTQTGEQVQDILNQAPTTEETLQAEITRSTNKDDALELAIGNEKTRAEGVESNLQTAIGNEKTRAEGAEGNLNTAIGNEKTRAELVEGALRTDVDGINAKIPTGASSENKLATQSFVNSSVATATAEFKGTYNSLEALETAVHDANANDYAFVISTDAAGNTAYNRYKYVEGTGWVFEYALNNSSFTSAQWAAINSAITAVLVAKLTGLPTATELTTQLNAIIDSVATEKSRAEGIESGLRTDVNANATAIGTEKTRAEGVEGNLSTAIGNEKTRAEAAELLLQQNINAEALLRGNADTALQTGIDGINAKIPAAASPSNQLADKAFVNSSIATNTATFRGTYDSVAALDEVTADNNDYAFVVATDTAGNTVYNRYKYVEGSGWVFEYALNNSSFTATQWAAVNSGITAALVTKLTGLPDNTALAAMFTAITSLFPAAATSDNKLVDYAQLVAGLATKQNTLTFDNVPVENSNNPVKSGGVYSAIATVTAAVVGLQSSKQDVLTFDQYPTAGSSNPVRSTGVYTAIDNAVAPKANQTALDAAVVRISTNEADIDALQAAYAALTESDIVVVEGALPSSGQQQNVIYRQPDPDHTPPQFYSDYMWNGTAWVLMATYNNAIDDEPTAGSNNLVKSGGVYDFVEKETVNILDKIDGSYIVQPSREDIESKYITSGGVWVTGNASVVIDVSKVRGKHITQTVGDGGQYAFLSDYDDTNVTFVAGGGRVSGTLNNTAIPYDAKYLYQYCGGTAPSSATVPEFSIVEGQTTYMESLSSINERKRIVWANNYGSNFTSLSDALAVIPVCERKPLSLLLWRDSQARTYFCRYESNDIANWGNVNYWTEYKDKNYTDAYSYMQYIFGLNELKGAQKIDGWLMGSNTFSNEGKGYYLNVKEGDSVYIKAGSQDTYYAFLSDFAHPKVLLSGSTRMSLTHNTDQIITIPSGCTAFYVGAISANTDYTPKSLIINGVDVLSPRNYVEEANIKNKILQTPLYFNKDKNTYIELNDNIVLKEDGDSLEFEVTCGCKDLQPNGYGFGVSAVHSSGIAIGACYKSIAVRADDGTYIILQDDFSTLLNKANYKVKIEYADSNINIYIDGTLIKTYTGQKTISLKGFGNAGAYGNWHGTLKSLKVNGADYSWGNTIFYGNMQTVSFPEMLVSKSEDVVYIYRKHRENLYIVYNMIHSVLGYTAEEYPSYYDVWGLKQPRLCYYDGESMTDLETLFNNGEAELAIEVPRGADVGDIIYPYVGGNAHGFENIDVESINGTPTRKISIIIDNSSVEENAVFDIREASFVDIKQYSKLVQAYTNTNPFADVIKEWIFDEHVIIKTSIDFTRDINTGQLQQGMLCVYRHQEGYSLYNYLTCYACKNDMPYIKYNIEDGWEALPANSDLRNKDYNCSKITEYGETQLGFALEIVDDNRDLDGGMFVSTNSMPYNKIYYAAKSEIATTPNGKKYHATQKWSIL